MPDGGLEREAAPSERIQDGIRERIVEIGHERTFLLKRRNFSEDQQAILVAEALAITSPSARAGCERRS